MRSETRINHSPPILICSPYLSLTPPQSIWEAASACDVHHVELLVNPDLHCPDLETDPSLTSSLEDQEKAGRIKTEAGEKGIEIELCVAPLLIEAGMTAPPKWAEKLLETAPVAGARQVSFPLITDNFLEAEISDPAFVEAAISMFESLCRLAHKSEVGILFENLSVYLNRPEILEKILDNFSKTELGFCLDPVNLLWFGHPLKQVYQIIEKLAGRATGLHVKNIKYPEDRLETKREPGWNYEKLVVPAEKGDIDYSRVVRHLASSGFDGYIGIEDDSLNLVTPEKRAAVLQSNVDFVRRLIAADHSRQA